MTTLYVQYTLKDSTRRVSYNNRCRVASPFNKAARSAFEHGLLRKLSYGPDKFLSRKLGAVR